ncbi:MAG TPA: hypothetical protein VN674_03520, partial [Gemmatimonadales bacterium]|nr:hypothetical protein [Gemmatimonadales bacterium]
MASDIHKKLVFGALGCGGLLVVFGGIGLLLSKDQLFKGGTAQQTYTSDDGVAAWDTLSGFAIADSLAPPSLPPWSLSGASSPGTLVLGASRSGDNLPAFGDTFPAGSKERTGWVESGASVTVSRPTDKNYLSRSVVLVAPPAGFRLFQARALFAAAETWSRNGALPDARMAMDSTLNLAQGMQHSGALERLLVGARIERDAMDMLSRDTVLAGGETAAAKARERIAPLDRFVARLRRVDRLLTIAGSQSANARNLGDWVADSALPLALRTAAVRAIGLGWVFSAT